MEAARTFGREDGVASAKATGKENARDAAVITSSVSANPERRLNAPRLFAQRVATKPVLVLVDLAAREALGKDFLRTARRPWDRRLRGWRGVVPHQRDHAGDDQRDHDPGNEDPKDRMSYVTAVESTAEPDPLPATGDATADQERATPDQQHTDDDDQPNGEVEPFAGFGRH